jgi:predicted MPP superfamily phosphohydrolase
MVFFLLFNAVWLGIHVYLGWRLLKPLARNKRCWRTTLGLLLFSYFIVPVTLFGRMLLYNPALFDALAWVAYLGMGFILVLFPLRLALDTILLTGWLAAKLRHHAEHTDTPNADRRRLLANTLNLGLVGVSGVMTTAGCYEARRIPRVTNINIPISGLPDGLQDFRIIQLSDIHLGPTIKGDYLQAIVEHCNRLDADMVVITGDLVDGFTNTLSDDVMPLQQLRSRYGTFFVTGNHEYYWGAQDWIEYLRVLDIHVLINEHHLIRHNETRLLLAGVTDFHAHRYVPEHASDPQKARAHAGSADMSILLAHQPKSAFAGAAAGYDLQLSGHVHGGQFFPWNFTIKLVQPFNNGLHRVKDRMWLYVSAGSGYWGPPQRLGVPSEITQLKLVRA